jgi:hypothetical protein
MNHKTACIDLALTFALLCSGTGQILRCATPVGPSLQVADPGLPSRSSFDPLTALEKSFPDSVAIKQKGHLIEFCPDNTCDGFLSSDQVPVAALKDFAYLYEYFFSKYSYLKSWRSRPEAREVARRVLLQSQYSHCRAASEGREMARCVLMFLSARKKVKLLLVRYDEGRRSVEVVDTARELSAMRGPNL